MVLRNKETKEQYVLSPLLTERDGTPEGTNYRAIFLNS